MFSEISFILLFSLGLLFIDRYSTFLAFITCIASVFWFVKYNSSVLNKNVLIGISFKTFVISSYIYYGLKRTFNSVRWMYKIRVAAPSNKAGINNRDLELEIDVLVFNVSKHYIKSWYDNVGDNTQFVDSIDDNIKEALLSLCSAIKELDKKKSCLGLLQIYFHFFVHFLESKGDENEFKWENFKLNHWAKKDDVTCFYYLQTLLSVLIDLFAHIQAGKALQNKAYNLPLTLVVEILTENIVNPLFKLVCDPISLNKLLLNILVKYILKDPNLKTKFEKKYGKSKPVVILPNEENMSIKNTKADNYLNDRKSSESYLSIDKSETFPQRKMSLDFSSKFQLGSNLEEVPIKSSSDVNLSDECFCIKTKTFFSSPIKRSRSADYIQNSSQLRALNEKNYSVHHKNNKMRVALKSDPYNFIEDAQEAIELEAQGLFSDVKIVDTTLQCDNAPYTLYTIQYSGVFHDTSQNTESPTFVRQVIQVKRRFREFVALQSRLEDNTSIKYILKGIKGPSKWQILPFQNLEKKNIAERRLFLEKYLQTLCTIPIISQTPEIHEFLAYGGDGKISFIKRGVDINVPRIDKMFVRGVKDVIDIFRTALPSGGSDSENVVQCSKTAEDQNASYRFQEHLLDYYISNDWEMKRSIAKFFQQLNLNRSSNCDFNLENSKIDTSISKYFRLTNESCNCSISEVNILFNPEFEFGDIIMDFLSVLFAQSSDITSTLKVLLSSYINKSVINFLENISEREIVSCIHFIHTSLWPNENEQNESDIVFPNINVMDCIEVILSSYWLLDYFGTVKAQILEKIYLFYASLQNHQANWCLLLHFADFIVFTLFSKSHSK